MEGTGSQLRESNVLSAFELCLVLPPAMTSVTISLSSQSQVGPPLPFQEDSSPIPPSEYPELIESN
jgi:hypothetical protein